MDPIPVDDNDLLMVSQLEPSLKPMHHLHTNHHNTSENTDDDTPPTNLGDSADIQNVFEYQQFIDRHDADQPEQHEGKTAMAALKMIDLDSLDADRLAPATESSEKSANGNPTTDTGAQKSGDIVHVEYTPNEKTKRLGRPRKHLNGMPAPTPDELASDNLEKATISKFRFDERPVEGPGSRGGDPQLQRNSKGKLTESSALKKRKQAFLNFTRLDDSASLGLVSTSGEIAKHDDPSHSGSEVGEVVDVLSQEIPEKENEIKQENAPVTDTTAVSDESSGVGSDPQSETIASLEDAKTNESVANEVKSEDATKEVSDVDESAGNTTETGISDEKAPTETSELANGDAKTSKRKSTTDSAETPRKRTRAVKEKAAAAKKKTTEKKPKEAKAKDAVKFKKLTLTFKPKTSRTTIIREKNRITRTYPGPLLPVHYDLYDDNLIGAKTNEATAAEKLALGFQVTKCDYLSDIISIIGYLSKFEHIVDLGAVGPQDVEEGLGLLEESTRVSPLMEQLFRRLLALVLNRKKPILLSMQKTAIQELRTQYIGLGLPEEWRDDAHIRLVTSLPCDPEKDRVDVTKPAVTSADNIEYQAPSEKMNPFLEKDFEEFGLLGIEKPIDRLIMLRCLTVWSLSASNQLKTYLTKVINGQDIPGERDSIYGSRAVLKGFAPTIELKKELELKISKKSKNQLTPKGTPDPDSISRYIDPTSDPLAHPMALRFNEFLVGDCGFHIGRFYLVRMGDASSGAISSIEKMKHVAKDAAGVRSSIPSSFKLYVEDVHEMLSNALPVYGPEFDEAGHELPARENLNVPESWYVVASNSAELSSFVGVIGARLGLTKSEEPVISLGSLAYKPLLYMYQYLKMILPLLEEFEKLEVTGVGEVRNSRKKKVDYSVQKVTEYEEDEFHEEEYGHVEEGDDDDYLEDGEGDADGEGEEYVE